MSSLAGGALLLVPRSPSSRSDIPQSAIAASDLAFSIEGQGRWPNAGSAFISGTPPNLGVFGVMGDGPLEVDEDNPGLSTSSSEKSSSSVADKGAPLVLLVGGSTARLGDCDAASKGLVNCPRHAPCAEVDDVSTEPVLRPSAVPFFSGIAGGGWMGGGRGAAAAGNGPARDLRRGGADECGFGHEAVLLTESLEALYELLNMGLPRLKDDRAS